MTTNNTLIKLIRCKLIIEEVEKGIFPSSVDLIHKITRWLESIKVLNDDIKTEISERTLKRDRADIKQFFNIEVIFDKKQNGYFIEEYSAQKTQILNMLNSIYVYFIHKNIPNANKYIRFTPRQATGIEHFFLILKAIENQKKIQFLYSQYEKQELSNRLVSPLGLKEFKGFWYLIASEDNCVKTFGLDRISNLNTSIEKTTITNNFDIDEYYKYCYGIVRLPNDEPQEIIIKTSPLKACYYKANPLHHSQKVIEETPDYTVFSFFMFLTYDLQQELRSHGETFVKVLKPEGALNVEKYR